MKECKGIVPKAVTMFLIFTVVCGLIYTGIVTICAQVLFGQQANGQIIVVDGKEYATLVTCTPYGVNSHRILMRGHRIANLDGKATPAEAVKIPTYIVIPAVGIPLLFIVLTIMLIYYRRKKPGKNAKDILDDLRKSD